MRYQNRKVTNSAIESAKSQWMILVLMFLSTSTMGQVWQTEKSENPFDGSYKAAWVNGKGEKYPYTNPKFVVNYFIKTNSLNIYVDNAGYSGCDDRNIYIKFLGNDSTYWFIASADSDRDVWFLRQKYNFTPTYKHLTELMKKYSKMYVRISSECGLNDLEFSLSGSSRALDFVIPKDYFKTDPLILQESYDNLIKMADDLFAEGAHDSALVYYNKAGSLIPGGTDHVKGINRINKIKQEIRFKERAKAAKSEFDGRGRIVRYGTNLNSQRDGFGEIIVHVPSGSLVELLDNSSGSEDDYVKIRFNDKVGFIVRMSLFE